MNFSDNPRMYLLEPPYQTGRGVWWPSGRVSNSGASGREFNTYIRNINSPKSTGNTQEAVA